jgi:hypothetical protein
MHCTELVILIEYIFQHYSTKQSLFDQGCSRSPKSCLTSIVCALRNLAIVFLFVKTT